MHQSGAIEKIEVERTRDAEQHRSFLLLTMRRKLADTNDGLRAFEITDNNGYVLCFGRPKLSAPF
jgi:hypothetical protein